MGSALAFILAAVTAQAAPGEAPRSTGVVVTAQATVEILRAADTRENPSVDAPVRHVERASGGRVTFNFE